MFRCAIDVRRWSIRLVLFGFWKKEPPTRLEARLIPGRSTARVIEQLTAWMSWYQAENQPIVVVGCKADKWPCGLARRLQEAGCTLQWIEVAQPLQEGVQLLRSLQENILFMRATVMAHWPLGDERKRVDPTILEVYYRYLRGRLEDLEIDMYVEGCCPCPEHLLQSCPDCEFSAPGPAEPACLYGLEEDEEPRAPIVPAEP